MAKKDDGSQGLSRQQMKEVIDYADKCAKGEQVLPVPAPRKGR